MEICEYFLFYFILFYLFFFESLLFYQKITHMGHLVTNTFVNFDQKLEESWGLWVREQYFKGSLGEE